MWHARFSWITIVGSAFVALGYMHYHTYWKPSKGHHASNSEIYTQNWSTQRWRNMIFCKYQHLYPYWLDATDIHVKRGLSIRKDVGHDDPYIINFQTHHKKGLPHTELVVIQWRSSGDPVCLELRPQCTLEWHWRNNCCKPVCFQWSSSDLPVVFQYVPITPRGPHWVLASASVVPGASQCTCGSIGLPVCSNYAN